MTLPVYENPITLNQERVFYELADQNGKPYYFDPLTNQTQWEKPSETDGVILPYSQYEIQMSEQNKVSKALGKKSNYI